MNIEVALFPNRAFYGGLLEPVGLPHQQGELTLAPELCDCEFAGLLTRRVAFLPAAVEPPAQSAKMNHSRRDCGTVGSGYLSAVCSCFLVLTRLSL